MTKKRSIFISLLLLLSGTIQLYSQNILFEKNEKDFVRLVWQGNDSVLIVLDNLDKIALQLNQPQYYAKAANARGTFHLTKAAYEQAILHYTEANTHAKAWKNNTYIGKTLNNIAACHIELKNYIRSEEYFTLAIEYFTLANEELQIRNTQFNLANIKSKLNKFDEAITIYTALESIYIKAGDSVFAGNCNMGIGQAYHNLEKYDLAVAYYNTALTRIDTINDLYTYSILLQNMAFTYKELKLLDAALQKISNSYRITKTYNFKKMQHTNAELLTALYESKNQKDSVIFYLKESILLQNELYNEAKQREFILQETQFNTALKESKIHLQDAIIREKNNAITYLIIGGFLLLTLLFVVLLAIIKIKKANSKLQILLTENEALVREIHHRVKNNLQIISSLLNMHVRKVKDEASKKILEDGSDRLNAMAIIHKNLYLHSDLKTISLKNYLQVLCSQLIETYQLNESPIILETDLEEVVIDIDKLIPIGLVVNELLSNAMKHAFKNKENGIIKVTLKTTLSNHIKLTIADNGIGIDPNWNTESNTSIGMKLIKIFNDKLKSTITIKSNNGTAIHLEIPL